ncbi:MAG: FtsL-like putative cell division protein [Saprospiraceae bacterium]|nr:FtsL-like putative cell division protein [Saprospiraceae bacterium]MDW8484264.1 FtsL-like putative cell division protein [Saprospiraceae bacterium]
MARKTLNIFNVFNISQRTTEWVFANFRYLLFLVGLSVTYIANAHLAEKNLREIQRLQREVRELKWEYTSMISNMMYRSMQSEVAKAVAPLGLELPPEGPKVIEARR